jgi:PAS domain S-box-containing protein
MAAIERPPCVERRVEALAAKRESVLAGDTAMDWTDAALLWRVLSASASISLVFQAIYMAADWGSGEARSEAILPLHLFNLLVSAAFLRITYVRALRKWMPQVILGGCTLLFAATAALSILTLNRAPLTCTLMITMVGSAALVPWNWRWQAGLGIAGIASFAALTLLRPEVDPALGYDGFVLLAAAGVAQYVALSGRNYRREIATRIVALQIKHRQLAGSEAKLRKIFETSSDSITINRLSDGRYLEVNEAFQAYGYTREEVLSGSAADLGVWANRKQLRDCMKALNTTGSVVNREIDLRFKDGRIEPFLISAKVLELDGEKCVVTIGRDIRAIKQNEELLQAEIGERTRAVEQREHAQQKLADSERKLRKIFDTSSDVITISRLSDGRYLDLNEGFSATGYSRQEALGQTAENLGIWFKPEQLGTFLLKLRTDGKVANLEAEVRTKSGTILPYLVSATVIELGGEACVVTLGSDITAIKPTEQRLRA